MLILSTPAVAEEGPPAQAMPSSVITAETSMQMLAGLIFVLAIIIGLAWLLKRFALMPSTSAGNLKIVAATGVGQREKVVIVEIDETWLVLGVAPGRVNKLHTLEKPATNKTESGTPGSLTDKFSEQLNQNLSKQ